MSTTPESFGNEENDLVYLPVPQHLLSEFYGTH